MKNASIGFQIIQTSRLIKNYSETSIREHSDAVFSSSEGMLLRYIYKKEDEGVVSAKMLTERFRISKATASELLSHLIRKGLIYYAPVESDGRMKRILLTQEGHKIQESLDMILSSCDETLVAGFSEEEKEELSRLLAKVRQNVKKEDQNGEENESR